MSTTRSSLPASKKRKTQSSDDLVETIRRLETGLTSALVSKSSLNELSDLLDIVHHTQDPAYIIKAIYALYRVFVIIIANGLLSSHNDNGTAKTVRLWLMEKLNTFADSLASFLSDEDASLKTSALDILMSLQKHLSSSLTKHSSSKAQPEFHISHFKKIVRSLLVPSPSLRSPTSLKKQRRNSLSYGGLLDPAVRSHFTEKWLDVHDDIRWFFLREASTILTGRPKEQQNYPALNLLSLLEGITTFPTDASELNSWWVEELSTKPSPSSLSASEEEQTAENTKDDHAVDDDWRKYFDEQQAETETVKSKGVTARLHTLTLHQSLHSLASHRAVFTRAWLMLLPVLSVGSADVRKSASLRVLNILHRGVLPHLTRAVHVMDWVGSCVDIGGTVGLLALNALFSLMRDYNLDYPSFYTRLYAFLDRDVLHLKHRARFFRLTEMFLSSTHLPAILVASFVKRLSRLSLNAPPAAIVMITPFTYNVLRKHPALMCMIHRVEDSDNQSAEPFQPDEPNPTLTNALNSSLWELYSQKSHYHAAVSTLTGILEEAFTRPAYSMEDFLDHSYTTLYDTEGKRRIRKEPAVETELTRQDVVGELWSFGL